MRTTHCQVNTQRDCTGTSERDRERQREKERDRERQREKEAKGGSLSPEAPSGLHPMESNDGGPNQPMTIGVWYTFVIPETLPR